MCYFLIKVLLLSANFETLVDATVEARVPESDTKCLWEPSLGHQSSFFTGVIQATGDSRVIFVFRLYSTVLEKFGCYFFAQCG